ncbi:MAG TPA: NosD domain-containing protein, partial [bacterium]|nr:NosD domain-containing protein [bacterium]
MLRLALIGIAAFACTVHFALAANINVPADYPTIQSAIDAAFDGDTVIVSPGIYFENIDFLGKAITVRSTDPLDWDIVAQTIIDGMQADSCVKFITGEGRNSIIRGLTITNGRHNTGMADGGGISCDGSSPQISNNIIRNNEAFTYGGGISAIWGGAALIKDNIISANVADFGGAVLAMYGGDTEVIGNVFEGNIGISYGTVTAWSAHITVANNTFSGNAAFLGDGVYCSQSSATITG